MTARLYYDDCYLAEFRGRVVERSADGRRLYLDQTAFYPASGGQPHDLGVIAGVAVLEVVEEDERIAHVTAAPVTGDEVACRIDWPRRFDHMQQHSGQHLLSAVLVDLFQAQTVGFHLGAEVSTIDVTAASLDPAQVMAAEARANALVFENRPVRIACEQAGADLDLRRASEREGPLRIVTIEGLDRSACGGTHVRATGEIGPILIRRLDKAHGCARIEFVCGSRAVRRARADLDALSRVARVLTAPLDEAPQLVAAQSEALQAAERARRKLAVELARFKGRELYEATPPDVAGRRRVVRRLPSGAIDDELRALAQSFTAQPQAVFVAAIETPPAILFAAAAGAGIHAGEALKAALTAVGGRGGGNAQLAQGSAPSPAALDAALSEITRAR